MAQNTNTVLRDRIDRYLEELDELIVLIGEKGVLTPTQKKSRRAADEVTKGENEGRPRSGRI